MNNSILPARLKWLLGSNLIATIALGIGLLAVLKTTEKTYVASLEISANKEAQEKLLGEPGKTLSTQDSLVLDSLKKAAQIQEQQNEGLNTTDKGVTFYLIVLLMLISGALGGVLCNLRGFFIHFRSDDGGFPANLEIPYYVRPFMGAGAGLFIYFVANFLITSVTTKYLATNIPFQGMVSFVALAILAGFGSLEFFQRLKETALALFGQKAEKDRWQKIEDLYGLYKKEVITESEFTAEKAKLMADSSDLEATLQRQAAMKLQNQSLE